jgi:hypothetical protein
MRPEKFNSGIACYVTELRPLAETTKGRTAIERHKLPPFIDASCRREPDLESAFPSITALCREGRLAGILKVGDVIACTTKDFAFPAKAKTMRRLVAMLRVKHSWTQHRAKRGLESHEQAAGWYQQQGAGLPSNCMASDEGRMPLDRTDCYKSDLEEWDNGYRLRAIECGAFHACEKIFCDVDDPPKFTTQQLNGWFNCIPNPREPQPLATEKFAKMLRWLANEVCNPTARIRIENLLQELHALQVNGD